MLAGGWLPIPSIPTLLTTAPLMSKSEQLGNSRTICIFASNFVAASNSNSTYIIPSGFFNDISLIAKIGPPGFCSSPNENFLFFGLIIAKFAEPGLLVFDSYSAIPAIN